MAECCNVCGAGFHEPLSLIAHLTSHSARLDTCPGQVVLGLDYSPLPPPRLLPAPPGEPEQDALDRCSPLNLAAPPRQQRQHYQPLELYPDLSAAYRPPQYPPAETERQSDGWLLPPCTSLPPISFSSEQPGPAPLPQQQYRCSLCDSHFTSRQDLQQHLHQHDSGKQHICHVCGLRLSQKSSLQRHVRDLHTENSNLFQCEICQKSFSQQHDLHRHRVLHDKPAVHRCERCLREFSAAHHLSAHRCRAGDGSPVEEASRRRRRRRRPSGHLPCTICTERCSTAAGWGFHMWRHTKDARYLPDLSVLSRDQQQQQQQAAPAEEPAVSSGEAAPPAGTAPR